MLGMRLLIAFYPNKPRFMTKQSKIRIGTSGWTYAHWQGVFYPEDVPKTKWLGYYGKHFNTVELNASFYYLPKPQTFINWRKRTPADFLFSVKASRYITHIKKLRGVREPWKHFIESAKELKEKLGPILFQLPPNLKADAKILESFLKLLPTGKATPRGVAFRREKGVAKAKFRNFAFAIEPRNQTWFCEEIYKILPEEIDFGVLAGYMWIVSPDFCEKVKLINLHPALPGGPKGSWQEVIWQLISCRSAAVSYTHLTLPTN